MHGGRGSGAPRGNQNALKDGFHTAPRRQRRAEAREQIAEAQAFNAMVEELFLKRHKRKPDDRNSARIPGGQSAHGPLQSCSARASSDAGLNAILRCVGTRPATLQRGNTVTGLARARLASRAAEEITAPADPHQTIADFEPTSPTELDHPT